MRRVAFALALLLGLAVIGCGLDSTVGADSGLADAPGDPDLSVVSCRSYLDCSEGEFCAQVNDLDRVRTQCLEGSRVACVPNQRGCVCVVGPPDPGTTIPPGTAGIMCFD